ncbi:MAG: VCBS repeat domain-containing M23 family metallopeptidase, partial [Kibdelosporangium sp.]
MSCNNRLRAVICRAVAALTVASGLAVVAPVAASAAPNFQLPFQCSDKWRLNTWDSGHAPALDMVHEPQSNTEGQILVAPAAGTVNQSYFHSNAGNMIQINHGGGHFTTYIHMQSRAVPAGARVAQGDVIGRVGHTGPTSNGVPHLHYEQGFDSNGDGSASWGFQGAERVTARFNGVNYGPAPGGEWRNVVSRNCGGGGGSTDITGDGRPDLLGRTASGDLLLYPHSGSVNGEATWRSSTKVSHGWGGMTAVSLGDVTGDGWSDLLGRTASGDLLLYPHSGSVNGEATWRSATKVGHGWGGMTSILLGDVTGDGWSDLVGRTASGDLLLYPHSGSVNGEATWRSSTKVRHGWDGLTAVAVGDVSGDGR